MNTNSHNMPGRRWIDLWKYSKTCEVIDSYNLSFEVYQATQPLIEWMKKHRKYVVMNAISLQSLFSQSCGDYAIKILRESAIGQTMQELSKQFRNTITYVTTIK